MKSYLNLGHKSLSLRFLYRIHHFLGSLAPLHTNDLEEVITYMSKISLDELRVEWANLTEEHFQALICDTDYLKNHNSIILNHFELIENFLDLHRLAKLNPNIKLNMVKG